MHEKFVVDVRIQPERGEEKRTPFFFIHPEINLVCDGSFWGDPSMFDSFVDAEVKWSKRFRKRAVWSEATVFVSSELARRRLSTLQNTFPTLMRWEIQS